MFNGYNIYKNMDMGKAGNQDRMLPLSLDYGYVSTMGQSAMCGDIIEMDMNC